MKKRIEAVTLGSHARAPVVPQDPENLSCKQEHAHQFTKAIQKCLALVIEIGRNSPRYAKVFNVDGSASEACLNLMQDVFYDGFSSPQAIGQARRGTERWIGYCRAVTLNPCPPSEWCVAQFL